MAADCGDRDPGRRETKPTDLVEARNSAKRTVMPFGASEPNEGGWAQGLFCRAQFPEEPRSLAELVGNRANEPTEPAARERDRANEATVIAVERMAPIGGIATSRRSERGLRKPATKPMIGPAGIAPIGGILPVPGGYRRVARAGGRERRKHAWFVTTRGAGLGPAVPAVWVLPRRPRPGGRSGVAVRRVRNVGGNARRTEGSFAAGGNARRPRRGDATGHESACPLAAARFPDDPGSVSRPPLPRVSEREKRAGIAGRPRVWRRGAMTRLRLRRFSVLDSGRDHLMGFRAEGMTPLAARCRHDGRDGGGRRSGSRSAALRGARPAAPPQPPPQAKVKLGLSINDPGAFRGYTLLNPMNKKTTYLIDMEGRVVKTWESKYNSMHAAYLLENGHLFRVATLDGGERAFGGGPGSAGRIQEFDWDGELVWDFKFHNDKQYPPPRRRQDAQRQRADGRLGQEDRRRGDRRRAEAGAGEQLRAARLDRGDQADGQDDRRGRLGMAPLGPPGPGPRLDQGELRRRGRASRAGRHQLRREPDGPRARRPGRGPTGQGGRSAQGCGEGRGQEGRGREAQDDRLRRLAHAASRSGSTRTGPTSIRSTTTPSSTRS